MSPDATTRHRHRSYNAIQSKSIHTALTYLTHSQVIGDTAKVLALYPFDFEVCASAEAGKGIWLSRLG